MREQRVITYMQLAVRGNYGRTAILGLEEAIYGFANRNHESALVENPYNSTGKIFSTASPCLKLWDGCRCGRASTRGVPYQKDVLSFSRNKPIEQTVNGGSVVNRLWIAAKWWISIIVRMGWITNIELSQVRGGQLRAVSLDPLRV